jgi:2-keto-4-pentenoate hydratase
MDAGNEPIAGMFVAAWAGRRQFDATSAGPASAEDAYLVQDKVFAARYPGGRAAAWKVGASAPGAEPNAAPIGEVRPSPAGFRAGEFHLLSVEAEVAFRIARDLPERAAEWTQTELADAVGEIVVTIELCDTRLTNWKSASALWRLADFQGNGALVAGTGTQDWRAIDFGAQRAELWVNGRLVVGRAGSHPLGNPFDLMPWAVGHCARRAGGLRQGDLVTTGSWTGMEFVSAGDTVEARFPGIGKAIVRID